VISAPKSACRYLYTPSKTVPDRGLRLHEVKYEGYRLILAR
jgi:hypothetical protein